MKPTISVIIPVYNVEKYISGCLASLLEQTFADYEAICVNDGSKDDSLLILEEYAEQDVRIKIISQTNKGLSGARNTGMDAAQGEYIFFLDADDYIHPQALEFLYKCAVEHGVELVCGRYVATKNMYAPMFDKVRYDNLVARHYADAIFAYSIDDRRSIHGMVWNKLYKRQAVANIRFIEGMYYEDEIFTALVLEKLKNIVDINFPLYYYYYNNDASITRGKFDEKTLYSHITNIRFLCTHFSYNKKIEKGMFKRAQGILFGHCTRGFPSLGHDERIYMLNKLKQEIKKLMDDGIITYKKLGLIGKYKLYEIINKSY